MACGHALPMAGGLAAKFRTAAAIAIAGTIIARTAAVVDRAAAIVGRTAAIIGRTAIIIVIIGAAVLVGRDRQAGADNAGKGGRRGSTTAIAPVPGADISRPAR